MNLYVAFSDTAHFLNIAPADPSDTFIYYHTLSDTHVPRTHTSSFANYEKKLAHRDDYTHFYTSASSVDELYTLHPELLI